MIPTPDALCITEEPIADLLETEMWPLLEQHREELTTNKALMRLAPDVDRYRAAETAGALVALVARVGGRMVGYSLNFVSQHLHYTDLRFAQNDVLFVTKDARASVGLRLLRATRVACAAHGAQMIAWHAKPDTPLAKMLAARRNTRLQDLIFTEVL
jgi:uncharacterized protein YqiB (DUF1249 family)